MAAIAPGLALATTLALAGFPQPPLASPGAAPLAAPPPPAPLPSPGDLPAPGGVITNDDPEDDRLVPLGARAKGLTSVTLAGNLYRFRFTGDETIEYQIDRGHADFAGGALRVTEATTGALLMRGGQMFRYDGTAGGFWTPVQAYQNLPVTLQLETLDGSTLRLEYEHLYQGTTHRVRYEIDLEGKSLRIRSQSLTPQNTLYANNYYGFTLGFQSGMPGSEFVTMTRSG